MNGMSSANLPFDSGNIQDWDEEAAGALNPGGLSSALNANGNGEGVFLPRQRGQRHNNPLRNMIR
jgi:hypothetical protein